MWTSVIGTLNEGRLHAELKAWYAQPGDALEQPVDGYVIDLVRGATLVEFQTAGLAPLRRKLERLLEQHAVRVVVPIARSRRIVRLSEDGEVLSARLSPRHGRIEDVFARLVSLPALLAHPRFELEVLLTHEHEYRRHEEGRARRRGGCRRHRTRRRSCPCCRSRSTPPSSPMPRRATAGSRSR